MQRRNCVICWEAANESPHVLREIERAVSKKIKIVVQVHDNPDGGGHLDKAGGFISAAKFEATYPNRSIGAHFFRRLDKYFESYDSIHFEDGYSHPGALKLYTKKAGSYGCVKLTDLFEPGTECKVRTLEGDVRITCREDLYVMLGYYGEVYPVEERVLRQKYELCGESFEKEFEYPPTIINLRENKSCALLPLAKHCGATERARILARPLLKPTKVFTRWNYETYMSAQAGDMLCYSENDEMDVYVIKRNIFENTYC